MPDTAGTLLETRALSKSFGGVLAVDAVSWSIGRGETRCIIGPNGAGKSTFFQLLVGQLRPTAGTILFDGRDITRAEPFERARLGIGAKPQTLGLFPELTVDHNLRLANQRFAHGAELDDRIARQLEELQIAEKSRRPVRELSHGEKQWLGLGLALALEPRLLLLDEPTAGMSLSETARTVEIIHDLSGRDMSIIAVEHDMAFVRDLGAHITVFHNGSVFATGSLAEIEDHDDVRRLYLGNRGATRLRGGVPGTP